MNNTLKGKSGVGRRWDPLTVVTDTRYQVASWRGSTDLQTSMAHKRIASGISPRSWMPEDPLTLPDIVN